MGLSADDLSNDTTFTDLQEVASSLHWARTLNTINLCLGYFKILKYLDLSPRLGQMTKVVAVIYLKKNQVFVFSPFFYHFLSLFFHLLLFMVFWGVF